jgi:uncharacterized protein YfaS (alpha-2-macroglobulin family)
MYSAQIRLRSSFRPIHSLVLVALFLLALPACKQHKSIKVVDTNFEEEIAEQQNLVFQFSNDLIPDSLLQRWDSTEYIAFEPKVKGSFRWNQTNELVFSPAAGFAPGVQYKATLTKALLRKLKGKQYEVDNKVLNFHTAPLRVESAHAQWTRGLQQSNVMLQLDIHFNYETDLSQAATKLQLKANGGDVSFSAISSGIGKQLSVQFVPFNENNESVDIKASLDKGIGIVGSKVASTKDTSFHLSIASRLRLEVTNTEAQHDGLQGLVDISLSQAIDAEGLQQAISIEPAVPFEASVSETGISIVSKEFNPQVSYNITLGQQLKGIFGGKLSEEKVVQASFGELEPAINFVNNKGMYLSSKGYRNLAINIVQVPKVEVTVVKVYENNIIQLLKQGNSYGYEYTEDDDYHSYEYISTTDLGDTVFSKTYDSDKLPKANATHLLHLDFADKLKGYDGVYVVTIASADQKWLTQSKILSLSDIGLIVKQEANKLFVFANSIRNATPISGAKISFISNTNQLVHQTTTDGEGVAVFDIISEKAPNFRIAMVSAKSGEEYSFLSFAQSSIETSRFDIGGRTVNATGLNAWLYAERNLYRPGETIHASVVVRNESWMPPGEMPVKLKLLMPNGKEFSNQRKILNEQGSAEVAYSIPHTAITGPYTLQVFSGNDVLLNSYYISVEDFMPDRIKVDMKLNKERYAPGDSLMAGITANNLFGTPAAGRNYDWELNLNKVDFQPKGFESYDFSLQKQFDFNTVFHSGSTDANGQAQEGFTLPADISESGILKGNAHATVFDETGRPVHRFANFEVVTQSRFIGIGESERYVGTRRPAGVKLIALDADGKVSSETATVTVFRKEWQNVIQQSGERYRYVSQWTEKQLSSRNISISGSNTTFSFTPDLSGEYEIRVSRAGSSSYVSRTFYAYGFMDTRYSSFEVNNEGNVSIKADKETYNPGQNMHLLFTAPFEGRMLVTIERDKVLEYHFLQTNGKSASLDIKATDAHLPNVYVSATLFRAMDASEMPLTVAHGYRNISVAASKNKMPVSVKVAAQSRSKTKQRISVTASPGAYLSIAAVDEGILQVKNYQSPDPYAYFFQKVALGVSSYDIYPLLLPEYKSSQSSTGGDGAASDQANRVNPLFVNRVKNVSYWSGVLQADASGHAYYDIDIPQFSGDLRVMVVAYKDKSFGSFDNHMKVADPIVISTALPRFLSPGDQALMPVTLSNTTAKATNALVSVQTEGALGLSSVSSQTISIPANREGRALFNISAANAIGAGKVLVTVKALNETFTNETELAVRPPASLQKEFLAGFAKAGSTENICAGHRFIPKTYSGQLVVAASPLVQFSKSIQYLVQYPYGCVEQTTSAAFPQLYYGDLVQALNGKTSTDINPNYNVQQAVNKLQAMQLPNGALSYWPGGEYESWWGSVYAAHFLIEAQKAGFEVNEGTIKRLSDYMRLRLKKKETIDYYYNGKEHRTIVAKEVPYSLYVLALAHQPQQSIMNYYKGNSDQLSLDGRYLLAAAFSLSGQADKAKQCLPPAFSGEISVAQSGGSFYSPIRDMGITLNALIDMDPANPQVAALARSLSASLSRQAYLNTQEAAFGILAMGKLAKRAAASGGKAEIWQNGKMLAQTNGAPVKLDLTKTNGTLQIKSSGKQGFYFFKEQSGVSADGIVKEEDKFLRVRRSFYNRNGQQISSGSFRQNELIVVKLVLESQDRMRIDNVVLTDMLPAGFEIENTRLNDMPNLKWVTERKDKSEPDYMDVRDDRLNLFTEVAGTPKVFYYMVRAVSPGTFKLGPVQADAMYNGMYHSYHGAATIKIIP